jgi:serine phosphatase RsbU (regulator of sigma subunit)
LRWHLGEGENSPAIPVADILLTLTNAATLWFLLIFLLRISHISLPKSVLWGTGAAIIFLTALGAYLDPEFTLRADLWSDSIGAALGVPIVLWGAKIHVARTEEFENDLEKEMEKTASISPMLYWFRVGLMVVTLLLTFAVNFSDIIRTEGAQFKEFLNWAHAALFPALIIASLLEIGSTTKKMRLFSKVMVDKALIDRDLLVGKEVQETLLPVRRGNNDAWAWRAFYYPAVSLAGDWFDIHKIKFSDDREFLLCCVADVTGHGIGAALITTTISSHWGIWLESISASPSPRTSEEKENFLIQAPATIHKGLCSLKRNAGCTAAFVLMDSEEKTMTFCTAGHPGIISHKPGDQKLGYHATSGTRLGFTGGEIKWEARTVPVLPGDSAYLFSDGIVPPGESVARWLKALQRTQAQGGPSLSVALLNAIRTNRSRFRQNRANEDDISLIILTSLG